MNSDKNVMVTCLFISFSSRDKLGLHLVEPKTLFYLLFFRGRLILDVGQPLKIVFPDQNCCSLCLVFG